MTDESILHTELLDEIPDEHRPDDEWIAARLRVDHEFRKRLAAGLQRKVKRNVQGGMGTGYTTSDEVWCHFKPTEDKLQRWIEQEQKGETRIDEQSALSESSQDNDSSTTALKSSDAQSRTDHDPALNNAEQDPAFLREQKVGQEWAERESSNNSRQSRAGCLEGKQGHEGPLGVSGAADSSEDGPNDAPNKTWLGMLPALRDGPKQS